MEERLVTPPDDADFRRAGAALLADQGLSPAEIDASNVRNALAAATLNDSGTLDLQIDGHWQSYEMPSTPFTEGIYLFHEDTVIGETWEVLRSLDDKNPQTNPEAEAALTRLALLYAEVAHLLWSLVVPASSFARWKWRRFGRPKENPFMKLDHEQMKRALDFFLSARTRIRLVWALSRKTPESLLPISPEILARIGLVGRRSVLTGIRLRGGIS